jgi:hypothetical protein
MVRTPWYPDDGGDGDGEDGEEVEGGDLLEWREEV